MSHLENVSVERLREALEEVDGKRPAQRLMVAIAYKQGVTQTQLAEWYDLERKTIYNWLDRLDRLPVEEAVRDGDRPGRPRKLTDDQLATFRETVTKPPREAGYDAQAWTPGLVQQYLREAFGADYSTGSCRRLLREAGLRYRRPRAGERPDRLDRDEKHWLPG